MAYGKEDFLNWDLDLNLDEILGDFTQSEFEISDSESVNNNKTVRENKQTKKLYRCSECEKDYASISGIRGHMRAKHGINKINATDLRPPQEEDGNPEHKHHFHIDEDTFTTSFTKSVADTLTNLCENTLRQKSSFRGGEIITTANEIKSDIDVQMQLIQLLCPPFYNIVKGSNGCNISQNEDMFSKLYQLTINEKILQNFKQILQAISQKVKTFYGVFCHALMKEVLKSRSQLYKHCNMGEHELTETDQQVIYYISGFMINAFSKCKKHRLHHAFQETLKHMIKSDQSGEKTFVSKYATWTEKASHGKLTYPSDNFFLLIREMDLIVRQQTEQVNPNKNLLNRKLLIENIVDNFMIQHYLGKIVTGDMATFVLEKCVQLFLTVRGFAWARSYKSDLVGLKETSLRKGLKERSSKNNVTPQMKSVQHKI